MKSELEAFDGLDNRKELIQLLTRLGSDTRRANFITSLMPMAQNFGGCRAGMEGVCDPVAAYLILVGMCNQLGLSINTVARRLEAEVRKL